MATNKNKSSGRGWHGDSKRHAEIGRKGGRARSANRHRTISTTELKSTFLRQTD